RYANLGQFWRRGKANKARPEARNLAERWPCCFLCPNAGFRVRGVQTLEFVGGQMFGPMGEILDEQWVNVMVPDHAQPAFVQLRRHEIAMANLAARPQIAAQALIESL